MRQKALQFTVCCLLISVSFAAEPSKTKSEVVKKEKQLESLKRKIVEKKKGLEYNVKKEHTILEGLERLDKALSKKEEDMANIENSLMRLKEKTQDVDVHIIELARDKERLSGLMMQRLAAMYKMKKGGIVESLFSSNPVNDIGRRYKYISKIVEYDTDLLKEYKENQLLLQTEKERLNEFEKEMLSLKDEIKHKKSGVEEEKDKKRTLLKDIRKKKDLQFAAIREMEDASKELQSFLERFKNDITGDAANSHGVGFAAMQGRLPMPVNGKIVSMYGKVEHPKFHTITFNNGIEIEARLGTEVRSVYKGRVAYSGWFRGYGKVVIIDHGNGYYTLFARLSKIVRDVDSIVEKGDVIALVGDTGLVKEPHLYFEVRQKGMPLDPLNWLAYNTKQK
ncbi:MAG: peptidoglycan DD-metalloendopeptidase family protein [Deltaproteobacteria bacterium]|nr:peptidoglycan DD-metalloendopeptidase family protein [Deltaproteobacteria bacterium]